MKAARALRPEDEISHYRIVSPLGAGGMGEVYLAQDRSLERNVALKILPRELVQNEERVRRFVLEAKSASSLSHPNIVTIYEIGQDAVRSPGQPESDPVHFISMELVSGKTLGTLIHDDKTDLRTVLGYIAQAAEGIAKAHAAGIVHRDLKPGNIMVSADGFAKVLDFGLAKLSERRDVGPELTSAPTVVADTTAEGIVLGTTGYMSPEQVQGKSVDHRSDIFSLGCVLYEAATRRRPFAAESGVETMHKILHEKPTPVEELNPEVPAELRRLIRRCLAKGQDQRLQSMKDLAIELREIVEEYDSLSASATSGSVASGTMPAEVGRRMPGIAILAAAGLVALLGIAVGWWGLQRGRKGTASQPFQTMRMTTLTSRGDVEDCALSADGRYVAYITNAVGRRGLRVRQVATGSDVEILPVQYGALTTPSFSPDGNYLFYCKEKPSTPLYRTLYRIPSLGGSPQELAFDVDSRVAFSPDGRQGCFWRRATTKGLCHLIVIDLGTGKERVLAEVNSPDWFQGAPSWSPDGRRLATIVFRHSTSDESTVVFFDPQSGRRHDFHVMPGSVFTSIDWLGDGTGLILAGSENLALSPPQVYLLPYPSARRQSVTNEVGTSFGSVSVARGDAVVAAVKGTHLANLWIADVAGGVPRAITSVSNPEHSPSFQSAGTNTVFYSARGGEGSDLWSIDAAGGEPRRLTSGSGSVANTRAGETVVAFERLDEKGNVHIWRVNADGSDLRQLTRGGGENLLWMARDGRLATFGRADSANGVWILSLETGQQSLLSSDAIKWMGGLFSPDGQRVLVAQLQQEEGQLIRSTWNVLPVSGGKSVASVVHPGVFESMRWVRWGPDGQSITYLNTADTVRNVYRQRLVGGPPEPVTRFREGHVVSFTWSRDGNRLAVIRRIGSSQNAWVTDATGDRPLQVTQFTTDEVFGLTWMPDSRRLVVRAGRSSRDAVLIRQFK